MKQGEIESILRSFLSALTGGWGIDRQDEEGLKAMVEREFIQEEE